MTNYADYRQTFSGIPKPFAYVDLDLMADNIDQVLVYSGSKTVRLGSKSIRCTAIMRRVLEHSDRFNGLLCFTAPEAVWLSGQGFTDLVVAYPTWERTHIEEVAEVVRAGKQITLMADSPEHIQRYAEVAKEIGTELPVCLDLNMATEHFGLYFGAKRTAVQDERDAVRLAQTIADDAHLVFDGLMGYESQLAGVADAVPGEWAMNQVKRALKRMSRPEVLTRRATLVRAIEEAGLTPRFINAGGSGSLKSNAMESSITEATAGSAFYGPVLFGHHHDYTYYPAAGYAIEIVRRPAPGVYTCLGGGYPASGASGAQTLPRPHLPEGATLDPLEGAGEVQTPIAYSGPITLRTGDPIFMRHAKAGELCERFNELHLISRGEIVDVVPTYRGQGQCFL